VWENLGPYFLGAGAALLLVGLIMLVVAAFRCHPAWGVSTLLVVPAPLFVLRHFRKALVPLLVLLLGVAVAATPVAVNRFYRPDVDLGPRESRVGGELHITLTGWEPGDRDYSVLRARPDTVVLQMANPDVTDRTLENLRGLKKLRSLDLSNTQVTDDGLPVLKELPSLEVLFLNGTRVTDAGLRAGVFPIASLRELSVRNTAVTKKARDEWRAARQGRKVVPLY
jgi:hypothetical protein